MNREHNVVCRNRNEHRNACISGYDVSLSARCNWLHFTQGSIRSSVKGDRYRLDPYPREQCQSTIVSRMKNFRCSRVAGSSWNLDSFHKHGSHLQQTFPGEPKPSAQQLVVKNDCCWMLLSLAAARPQLFPFFKFNFIEQRAVVGHSIITLNTVVGQNEQMVSRCAHHLCGSTHQENESHFLAANSSYGQQCKHFTKCFNAMVQPRHIRWIQNTLGRHLICTYSCCIQIISVRACLYNLTQGSLNILLKVPENPWHILSKLALLQVSWKQSWSN